MTELTRPIRRLLGRRTPDNATLEPIEVSSPAAPAPTAAHDIAVDIPDNDPLLAYLQSAPGPVDVARLELDSPAVRALR